MLQLSHHGLWGNERKDCQHGPSKLGEEWEACASTGHECCTETSVTNPSSHIPHQGRHQASSTPSAQGRISYSFVHFPICWLCLHQGYMHTRTKATMHAHIYVSTPPQGAGDENSTLHTTCNGSSCVHTRHAGQKRPARCRSRALTSNSLSE